MTFNAMADLGVEDPKPYYVKGDNSYIYTRHYTFLDALRIYCYKHIFFVCKAVQKCFRMTYSTETKYRAEQDWEIAYNNKKFQDGQWYNNDCNNKVYYEYLKRFCCSFMRPSCEYIRYVDDEGVTRYKYSYSEYPVRYW